MHPLNRAGRFAGMHSIQRQEKLVILRLAWQATRASRFAEWRLQPPTTARPAAHEVEHEGVNPCLGKPLAVIQYRTSVIPGCTARQSRGNRRLTIDIYGSRASLKVSAGRVE